MDYQRSKYLFRNKFWVLGGLLVTLESLKSVRALSAPTQVITSFQSSGGIGLKMMLQFVDFGGSLAPDWNCDLKVIKWHDVIL